MYLHIGKDMIVHYRDIVAIISLHQASKSDVNREFMQVAEIEGSLQATAEGEPAKSMIITSDRAVLSSISAATLVKRVHNAILSES